MNNKSKLSTFLPIFIFAIILGLPISDEAYSQTSGHSTNIQTLTASGFVVDQESIQPSEIKLKIPTSTTNISHSTDFEGSINIGTENFLFTEIEKIVKADGDFLRINGLAKNDSGDELRIQIFGRLIEENNNGSVLSFNGRIIQDSTIFKVIYTAKFFEESDEEIITTSEENNNIVINILKNSADPSSVSYIGTSQSFVRGYYSMDRIIIEPGTTITWVNNDDVSHSISSGSGLTKANDASSGTINICHGEEPLGEGASYKTSNCTFTTDDRISSGDILPGESWSITVQDAGFYRLADIDYIWMTSTIYAFPNSDSIIIRGSVDNLN